MTLIVLLRAPMGQIAAVAATVGTTSPNGKQFPDLPPAVKAEEIPAGSTRLRPGNNRGRLVLECAVALCIEDFNVLAIQHVRCPQEIDDRLLASRVWVIPLYPAGLMQEQSRTNPRIQVEDRTLLDLPFPRCPSPS